MSAGDNASLEQSGSSLSQGAALAFHQWYVCGKDLTSHPLPGEDEAVAATVHIRIVDLAGITDEHELGAA